jgi:tetratricopeptide (TPR) repeat protein
MPTTILIPGIVLAQGARGDEEPVRPSPGSIAAFVSMSDEAFLRVDMATLNLACAVGLPGSDNIDRAAASAKLDEWAGRVRAETTKYDHKYHADPAYFNHSIAQYRIEMMITVLMLDLGVRYHPDRLGNVDFTKSADLFLHGLLDGDGGTCCSMPVLYVAIGRRLGYPLKLVESPEHLFLRWDDPETGERFNIEGTSRGFVSEPDEYYETWPRPMTESERRVGYFHKPLTPKEELATFLTTRGHALFDLGRLEEARQTYETALRLSPKNIPARVWLRRSQIRINTTRVGADATPSTAGPERDTNTPAPDAGHREGARP